MPCGCASLRFSCPGKDGDGNLDILLVVPHPALYKGDGKGHFTDVTNQTGLDKLSGHFLGCAVGDYDNDGRIDALIVDAEGTPLLLHNLAPRPGHWLLCNLVGAKSNRDGIGALLTIEAGGKKLLRRCATDGSYMSASDKRVHVGLGDAATATITIHWPSGIVTTYPNLPANQIVTLKETGGKENRVPKGSPITKL